MCINSTKGGFTVDGSGKYLWCQIICTSKKDILFCISFSIVNDMVACRPFRRFCKTSKCSGKVKKQRYHQHTAGS